MRTPETCRASLVVPNALGLHARPAAMLASRAQQYDSDIVMEYGRRKVNAKSVLGILTLSGRKGAKIAVMAKGHDAFEAIRAIEGMFACSFHDVAATPEMGSPATAKQTA